MNNHVKAFIAGSSFPVIVWPFLYIGINFILNPNSGFSLFHIGAIPIYLPIVYGLANVISFSINQKWIPKNMNKRMWLTGASFGILYSLYGNFIIDVPTTLYQLSGFIQYLTIPAAAILYAFIWRYAVKNMNLLVGIR